MIKSTRPTPAKGEAIDQATAGPGVALLLGSIEAAKALDISPRKLWELTAAGKIPYMKIGRSTKYSVAALHDWIQSQLVQQ